MLTCHQWRSGAFIREQFHVCLGTTLYNWFENYTFRITVASCRIQLVNCWKVHNHVSCYSTWYGKLSLLDLCYCIQLWFIHYTFILFQSRATRSMSRYLWELMMATHLYGFHHSTSLRLPHSWNGLSLVSSQTHDVRSETCMCEWSRKGGLRDVIQIELFLLLLNKIVLFLSVFIVICSLLQSVNNTYPWQGISRDCIDLVCMKYPIMGSTAFSQKFINPLRPSDTYICVGDLTTIGSDNGLSPGRRQAIIWTNAWILLIGPSGFGNKLQWNLNRNPNIFIQENSFESVVCEIAAILSWPQCVKSGNLFASYRFVKDIIHKIHQEGWMAEAG